MELFPQRAGLGQSLAAATATATATKIPEIREQERGQLTIFYGGEVMVFDDFPSNKAKDLMKLARKGTSTAQSFAYMPPPSTAEATVLGHADGVPNQDSKPVPVLVDAPKPTTISALPQPPKASLRRFLAERKHRFNTLAPYQITKPPASDSPLKPEESKSWLGLAPQVSTPSHSINSNHR